MYIPKHFEQPNIDVMHALIRAQPLATLITLSADGLNANHIPLHLSGQAPSLGILRGHIARSNSLWRDYAKDMEVLAVFQGPDAYITPSWYPTKAENGKAVPTWNFVVAHAYGTLRVIHDPSWLRSHLEALTTQTESPFAKPWHVADAPYDYTEKLISALVGLEIEISRLLGKWKISQNQPAQNKAGIVEGLRTSTSTDALAMAALVENAPK